MTTARHETAAGPRRLLTHIVPVCLALWVSHAGVPAAAGPKPPADPVPSPTRPGSPPGKEVPAPKPVLLRYQFTEGEAVTYRLSVRGKGTIAGSPRVLLPVSLEMDVDVERRVARVLANGRAEVVLTGTVRRLRMNGDAGPAQGQPPWGIAVTVSPSGAVHEWRAQPGTRPVAAPGVDAGVVWAALQRLAFPDHPVQPGDAWPLEAPAADGGRQQTTFLGLEETGKRQTARLRHTFALPVRVETGTTGACAMTGRHAGDLTVRFDVEGGAVLDAAGTVDVVATLTTAGGAATDVRWHLVVRLNRL